MASAPRPSRGSSTRLWDGREWPCAGRYAGRPVFRYRWAPPGLYTVRQLAVRGLRPAGQDPAGYLAWGFNRWAYLYRLDLAKPKRVPTAAQRRAIERCNVIQQWCPSCRSDVGYRIPRSLGECVDCAETAIDRYRSRHEHDEQQQSEQHGSECVGRLVDVVNEHVQMRESA